MKARVIKTGDIIEISEDCSYLYAENYDKSYNINELEFLDVKEKSLPKDEPDYWEKLKHQAAISAMSAFLVRGCHPEEIAQFSLELAGVMVNKLKEEEK